METSLTADNHDEERVIVGVLTGDSDDPGVTEDLTDVIVWNYYYNTIVDRFDRYGGVPVTNTREWRLPADDAERGTWINKWAFIHEREAMEAADEHRALTAAAERDLAAVTAVLATAKMDSFGNSIYPAGATA